MMATPLLGLGVWIWELQRCESGDLDRLIDRATLSGVSWVAIKAGEDRPNGQITRQRVEYMQSAGIDVAAWWYCVPGATDTISQLAMLKELAEIHGVQHLICDAEIEWEEHGDRRPEAATFAQAIRRAVGPDVYLADAPWPIVSAHPTWPWGEFGSVVDARMDQSYWMQSGQPFATFAGRADANWEKRPQDVRCPIGCTVNYSGTQHAPLSELGAFLDRYADNPARSLWSWQHLSANEWALLAERAKRPAPPGESFPPDPPPSGPAAA